MDYLPVPYRWTNHGITFSYHQHLNMKYFLLQFMISGKEGIPKDYRKSSKNWDTWNNYHNCPTIGTVGFYSAVLCSKDADRITNREDPDQTAPWGAVWSGSALFAQTYLSQYLKLLRCNILEESFITSNIIIIIRFLINMQVQRPYPQKWAPFQATGLLQAWQISHQISRCLYHEGR